MLRVGAAALLSLASILQPGYMVNRRGKLLNVFSIVKFPNDHCSSGSNYGSCYSGKKCKRLCTDHWITASECAGLGGESIGSCASG